ncbi:hypothetical protein H9P43_006773 [Blastocladiella emersonii ATCC 22665]|nr:hypothetical protein H9P43_006773 [Blastocladiella emersonii ATCC 22665]
MPRSNTTTRPNSLTDPTDPPAGASSALTGGGDREPAAIATATDSPQPGGKPRARTRNSKQKTKDDRLNDHYAYYYYNNLSETYAGHQHGPKRSRRAVW